MACIWVEQPLCLPVHNLSDSKFDPLIQVNVYSHKKGEPWHTSFQNLEQKKKKQPQNHQMKKNPPPPPKFGYHLEFFEEGENTLFNCITRWVFKKKVGALKSRERIWGGKKRRKRKEGKWTGKAGIWSQRKFQAVSEVWMTYIVFLQASNREHLSALGSQQRGP